MSRLPRPLAAFVLVVAGLAPATPPAVALGPAAAPHRAQIDPTLATAAKRGPVEAWVMLSAQADLREAARIADWGERGRAVVAALKSTAGESQRGVRGVLKARGLRYQSHWAVNAIRVPRADAATLASLAARPEVRRIIASGKVSPPPLIKGSPVGTTADGYEWGISDIGAPAAWSAWGTRGEGIVVGVLDTGVEYTHPALVASYRGNNGDGTFSHDYNWFDVTGSCPVAEPCDDYGHGTHVTGTIAGDTPTDHIGVAPGAKWIAANGCAAAACSYETLLAGGEWFLAPTDLTGQNPRPDLRPNIISNSWGIWEPDSLFFAQMTAAWAAAGIVGVFAAGNEGEWGCSTLRAPGTYADVITVGAYDSNREIAPWSSRGPSNFADATKPDLAGPGVDVRSSVPGGGYEYYSGTSMATPHVAGTVALLLGSAPLLVGEPGLVREALEGGAVPVEDLSCGGTATDNDVWGHGRLDVLATLDGALRGPSGFIAGTVTAAESGAPIAGATVSIAGATRIRTTRAGSDGGFRVRLPVGAYDVSASAFARIGATLPGVEVAEDATTSADIVLDAAPTYAAAGVVLDSFGAPQADVEVAALGIPIEAVTSGADGSFALAGLPDGDYTLRLTPRSGCQIPSELAFSIAGADLDGLAAVTELRTDRFGHYCRPGPASALAGTSRLPLSGDDGWTKVKLPFKFVFYGRSYDAAAVSINGAITFGTPSLDAMNWGMPAYEMMNSILPYWADLRIDAAGGVYTGSVGSGQKRRFVVEWRNALLDGTDSRVNFAVALAADGSITTSYGALPPDEQGEGGLAAVGLESDQMADYFVYSDRTRSLRSATTLEWSALDPDTKSPSTPRDVRFTYVDDWSIAFEWAPSSDVGRGVAYYEIWMDGEFVLAAFETGAWFWAYQSGPFTLQIRAVDWGGNVSGFSSPISWPTWDRTAPSAPTDLTGAINTETGSDVLVLTWSPSSDDVGLREYWVYDGRKVIGAVPAYATEYWLVPVFGSSYRIKAVDYAGNVSSFSNTFSF